MSVVGVDLGTLNTAIAVARNRGVDVITNEVSNRATPTLVGFGPKSRYLGEGAKTQEVSNLKNTIGNLKRLIGRKFSDTEIPIEQQFVSAELVDCNGEVGAKINYLGEQQSFTATQLVAMFLSKVKQTASNELKLPVSDVVLSVPSWFTDAQRRAIMDACEVAGLKLLRLMNDTTATALGYGITKTDLPAPEEKKPRRVVFIDIGHSNYTCTVVEFQRGELSVKSSASDRHFGGRDFDKALMEHFAVEIKEKYKIDVLSNPKAKFRLGVAVEKLKKILSANAQAPLNVESIMNDIDVSSSMKREQLEELVKPLLERVTGPIETALKDAGLTPADIDAIELVGGCTRVPSLKERIQQYFGKPLSFTLNQDEAIARGCAFACAILSPVFRVRDFAIHDIVAYPIEFTWEQSPDIPDEDTALTVFKKHNAVPSTKILTFYRKEPFDLEARYAEPQNLPGAANPWIAKFTVKGVKPDPNDDFMVCKLKARLNLHGVLNVESGYYTQEIEVEEPVPAPEGEKKDGDEKDKKAPEMRKVKKTVKGGDLPVLGTSAGLDQTSKDLLLEKENQMVMEDKLVADTEDRKNALEEYIYEMRGKIEDLYADFSSDEEKEKLRGMLTAAEDWLYDEGYDATKAQYIAKFEEIRAVAGLIVQRYLDKQESERAAEQKAREEADEMRRAAEQAAKMREDAEKKAAAAEAAAAAGGEKGDDEMTDASANGAEAAAGGDGAGAEGMDVKEG